MDHGDACDLASRLSWKIRAGLDRHRGKTITKWLRAQIAAEIRGIVKAEEQAPAVVILTRVVATRIDVRVIDRAESRLIEGLLFAGYEVAE